MSGIVGTIATAGGDTDRFWVQGEATALSYRGPDGSSSWWDEHAALGHASLRTDDTHPLRMQPLSLDDRLWITGDIRLDGRDDLVRRLRDHQTGITRQADDAEIVLRAYDAWGEGCLEHITGDFAFAIWDRSRRRLFCARDQFGVGAFFYAIAGERIVFSNSIESVLSHGDVSDDLDDAAIGDCLVFGMNMNRATTTFANIRRLAPGHSLTWTNGAVRVQQYWTPEFRGFVSYRNITDYVERFRELFTRSVADRLRTNRLSVELSGGLDSTSVAVTAQRLLSAEGKPFSLQAHTIVLDGLMKDDEATYARLVADAEGIPVEQLDASSYPLENPAQPVAVTPEPMAYRWTRLEHDFVSRAAKHARVTLTGHGGDAALMFVPSYWIDWLGQGHINRLAVTAWQHLRLFHRPLPLYLRPSVRHAVQTRRGGASVPDWIDRGFASETALADRSRRVAREAGTLIERRGMAAAPFWSNVLNRFDPGFTRQPVRYRHPFFDVRLVEYLLALPPAPWFPNKKLLRDAMRPVLPKAIVNRRKTPLAQTLSRAQIGRGVDIAALKALATAPDLDRYIDRNRFAQQLDTLAGADAVTERRLIASLGLAHWLFHRRRNAARSDSRLERHG